MLAFDLNNRHGSSQAIVNGHISCCLLPGIQAFSRYVVEEAGGVLVQRVIHGEFGIARAAIPWTNAVGLLDQDVDQRLTRDVERLCNDLAALIPSAVKPVVDLLWFR